MNPIRTQPPTSWCALAVTLALPLATASPARADELDDLATLGQTAIDGMSDMFALSRTRDVQQNRALLAECLGVDLTTHQSCTEADTAGQGLVCPPAVVTPTPDAACDFSTFRTRSASLTALAQRLVDYDDDFRVDIKVADTRTAAGVHAHLQSGARVCCAPSYVKQQDTFRLFFAIYQGTSGQVTLPNDPRDGRTLGAAEVTARTLSGRVLKGPVRSVCRYERHVGPRSCSPELLEPLCGPSETPPPADAGSALPDASPPPEPRPDP